jgi:hypothetical protein
LERRVQTTKQFLIERGVSVVNIETKVFGLQRNLNDAEVREAVENSPELSAAQREKMLDHSTTIILASNRRVDITLNLTGQRSIREYPFNAVDSLTLLNPEESQRPAAGVQDANKVYRGSVGTIGCASRGAAGVQGLPPSKAMTQYPERVRHYIMHAHVSRRHRIGRGGRRRSTRHAPGDEHRSRRIHPNHSRQYAERCSARLETMSMMGGTSHQGFVGCIFSVDRTR